jgi:polynucleotide 5'-kinase involved in rRNA processing
MLAPSLHLPQDWNDALARAARARRVAVLGPPDSGKSSFIRALAACVVGLRVIDLDLGQKMIGAPGTASLGRLLPQPELDRFVFLGSSGIGSFRTLAGAAATLCARVGGGPFVVNTSGYVLGPGARLQAMTLGAVEPDLVVALAPPPALEPVLGRLPHAIRLSPSPFAARKGEGFKRRVRQRAFEAAIAGAAELDIAAPDFQPGPPLPWQGGPRPVCALAGADGLDLEIGIVTAVTERGATVLVRAPATSPRVVRLGKMWAEPRDGGWTLLERLTAAWTEAPR